MASTVREIMNRELFAVRPHDRAVAALDGILGLGICAAPVVDEERRPLGVVSLRDLITRTGASAADRMTTPALVVRVDAPIAEAARLIAEAGHRRLVAVDALGRAVGMVSAVDVIRGTVGLPAPHPGAFPHLDATDGLVWTDDTLLDDDHIDVAPDGPGVLALIHDAPGAPRRVVWRESTHNVRTRLLDLLSLPQDSRELAAWLDRREHLRFRAAPSVPRTGPRDPDASAPRGEAGHPPIAGTGARVRSRS